jgi:hypothetical protein
MSVSSKQGAPKDASLSRKVDLELNSDEAGTTGITGITGISLVVRYVEPFFQKAFSSFSPRDPCVPRGSFSSTPDWN